MKDACFPGASITKDFGAASTNTTGRAEDMAITGDGWFTLINSDGKVLLTRDGTFSLDENGYLCSADGSKVLGMDEMESMLNSTTPIKMPTSLKIVEEGTRTDKFLDLTVKELNALGNSDIGVRDGDFKVKVAYTDANNKLQTATYTIRLGDVNDDDVNINDFKVSTLKDSLTNAVAREPANAPDPTTYFTVDAVNGQITFTPVPNAKVDSLAFESIEEKDGGTNFLSTVDISLENGVYKTKPLNMSATIGAVDDVTSPYTQNYDSFSVGKDGLVTVTYGDGSILTVKAREDGQTYFSYQSANGVIINDDDTDSLYVDPNVLVKANMQLQLAKVVNNGGLVAEGNNQYSVGVNCGKVLYTAANINGVGGVVSGALESSNVDLAQQFSNMILAQRLVQANSQVFSGANQLLETLVYLGQ